MRKLTNEDRCKIEALHKSGLNASKIAVQIGRHKSTVIRELSRNSYEGSYDYKQANKFAKERRSTCGVHCRLREENWTYVRTLLHQKWSPEQISGWLRCNPDIGFYVSAQWIYEYIYKDKEKGGDLYENLRRSGRPYRSGKFRPYRGKIKDRIGIESRPEIVDRRLRIGDWEVDSVIGKLNQSSIVTLVERVSRYTAILKVNSKESQIVSQAIISRIKNTNLPIHTMTGDNGTEFSEHRKISESLGIDFYFTHPYSSWEKGTNENTNGLIRQYFPKGTDFNTISDEAIMSVENQLNNRPRKCLKYKKPAEILMKQQKEQSCVN